MRLRIRRNADTLGSVTSIKMGVKVQYSRKLGKVAVTPYIEHILYQYLLYSIFKALNSMLYINTYNYSSAQKLMRIAYENFSDNSTFHILSYMKLDKMSYAIYIIS